jgi:hypothetical protein
MGDVPAMNYQKYYLSIILQSPSSHHALCNHLTIGAPANLGASIRVFGEVRCKGLEAPLGASQWCGRGIVRMRSVAAVPSYF